MATDPSVTNTFVAGNTIASSQANQNFTDLINFLKLTGVAVFQAGTVTTAAIANLAVDATKIALLAVGTPQLANGAVTNAKLGASATFLAPGLLAARPGASTVVAGTMYFATDVGLGAMYRSDGSSWIGVGRMDAVVPGAGSVTSTMIDGTIAKSADVQVFTAGGTWTKPAGAKTVHAIVIGSGGGGGSGRRGATSTVRAPGGGGGGGAYGVVTYPAADLASTVSVTVAAGGAGGVAQAVDSTNGNAGNGGATSYFGSFGAGGGLGGGGGSTSTGAGGAGGAGMFPGGAGSSSSAAAQPVGAAGGSAGGGIDATNTGFFGGNSTVSLMNLNGGFTDGLHLPGGTVTDQVGPNSAGVAGTKYGGGGHGGGGVTNGLTARAGGDGAAGLVVVVSYF